MLQWQNSKANGSLDVGTVTEPLTFWQAQAKRMTVVELPPTMFDLGEPKE